MKKLLFLSLPLMLWACGGDHSDHDHGDHDHADHDHGDEQEVSVHTYGESFSPENAITFAELKTQMENGETGECVLEAEIVESCQKMGCWMSVATDGEPMMVYMNDHAFFVPKQGVAGLKAYIKGQAYYDTLTVEFQQHLLEDAARPQEEIDAITEPKYELAFDAVGVIIEGYDGEDEEMNEEMNEEMSEGEMHEHHDDHDHDHDHEDAATSDH